MNDYLYPIGEPGKKWGAVEKQAWHNQQTIKRSYKAEVLDKLTELETLFEIEQYGELSYQADNYPLFALRSRSWHERKPIAFITGGVHGYETSGVQGALRFAAREAETYSKDFNIIVAPCVSPWGYETINRWNPDAIDPNRSFVPNSPAKECELLMTYVKNLNIQITAHLDLHETTDTDNSEFRPALAARDATTHDVWDIPDGFYLVGNTQKPAKEFQKRIIDGVSEVTHIAPADENEMLIGSPITQKGVINYRFQTLGMCTGFTNSPFSTLTEMYPDSPRADDEICIQAQVKAVTSGLDYIREQSHEQNT